MQKYLKYGVTASLFLFIALALHLNSSLDGNRVDFNFVSETSSSLPGTVKDLLQKNEYEKKWLWHGMYDKPVLVQIDIPEGQNYSRLVYKWTFSSMKVWDDTGSQIFHSNGDNTTGHPWTGIPIHQPKKVFVELAYDDPINLSFTLFEESSFLTAQFWTALLFKLYNLLILSSIVIAILILVTRQSKEYALVFSYLWTLIFFDWLGTSGILGILNAEIPNSLVTKYDLLNVFAIQMIIGLNMLFMEVIKTGKMMRFLGYGIVSAASCLMVCSQMSSYSILVSTGVNILILVCIFYNLFISLNHIFIRKEKTSPLVYLMCIKMIAELAVTFAMQNMYFDLFILRYGILIVNVLDIFVLINFFKREYEQKDQKIEISDALLGDLQKLVHDIMTPLKFALATMKVNKNENSASIIRSLDIMEPILRGILSVGQQSDNKQKLNLYDIYDEVAEILKPVAQSKQVQLVENFDRHQSVDKIFADKNDIIRVYLNLIGNAIKHSDPEHGIVTISSTIKSHGLTFRIDNYISEEEQQEPTQKSKYGSGYGNVICKEILLKYGGFVTWNADKDLFTTKFFLPFG